MHNLSSPVRVAVIGLGHQNLSDHIPNLLLNPNVILDSVCDLNTSVSKKIGEEMALPYFDSVDKLLEGRSPDCAIVAIPHYQYPEVIEKLARKGIHIFKEKPFATSLAEAKQIDSIAQTNNIKLMVAVQRKFNTIFQKFDDYKNRIGKIYSIHGHYTLNIARLDEGWRAKRELAGGGALLDMGYHLVDLLIWYFGLPDSVTCRLGYNNRENQHYNVEDTAKILFDYNLKGRSILGSLLISRIYPTKEETLTIYGTQGTIEIKKNQISLLTIEKEIIESLVSNDKNKPIYDQLDYFINWVSKRGDSDYSYTPHFDNVSFIEACYNSHLNNNTEIPKSYLI